jgi:hypothetical protein
LRTWLDGFPDYAMREVGLVDRSLVALFEKQRIANHESQRRVYIWSLDAALAGYDRYGG